MLQQQHWSSVLLRFGSDSDTKDLMSGPGFGSVATLSGEICSPSSTLLVWYKLNTDYMSLQFTNFVCISKQKLKSFLLWSEKNILSSRWSEEPLRILGIPPEQQQLSLNDLLGFSKITRYLFFICNSNVMLLHEKYKLGTCQEHVSSSLSVKCQNIIHIYIHFIFIFLHDLGLLLCWINGYLFIWKCQW